MILDRRAVLAQHRLGSRGSGIMDGRGWRVHLRLGTSTGDNSSAVRNIPQGDFGREGVLRRIHRRRSFRDETDGRSRLNLRQTSSCLPITREARLQLAHGLRAIFRVLRQTCRDGFFPSRRDRFDVMNAKIKSPLPNWRRDLLVHLLPINHAQKGRFTGQKLVQRRANRIDIVHGSR